MRERKNGVYECNTARHRVKLSVTTAYGPQKRYLVEQTINACSHKIDRLCTVDLYPSEGESQCPAVQAAIRRMLKI